MEHNSTTDRSSTSPRRAVGFIGLGLMGHGLALHAQKAGYRLRLLVKNDADRSKCADLLRAGATGFSSPRELASASDVVVICVTGSPQVEEVVFADAGLLAGLRPGMVVVDCSTSLPASSRRIAKAVAAKGGMFLDAAMTGTPSDADKGDINLLVGGDVEVLASVRPVLESFARNIYHCGGTGAGHSVKLLHQFVVLSNAAVLAEAISFAGISGVDTEVLCDVIASGGANSTAFQRLRPFVKAGRDESFRFTLANALKDMHYYTQMTGEAKAVCAIGDAVHNSYRVAYHQGLSERFVPHLIGSLDRLNGVATAG